MNKHKVYTISELIDKFNKEFCTGENKKYLPIDYDGKFKGALKPNQIDYTSPIEAFKTYKELFISEYDIIYIDYENDIILIDRR